MSKTDERYYVIPDSSHIGWTIIERIENTRKEIFYHSSKNVVETALKDLLKGKFDATKYPQITDSIMIVKFKEKHGDLYYVYTSREEFFKIFLEVLIERYNQRWYSYEIGKPKQEITMTLEEINALPDEQLKKFQLDRYKKYQRELREYTEYVTLKNATDKAYKEKNAKLAYSVLRERKDGEYEGFEIIEPNRAD